MVFLELRRDSRVTTGNSGCLLCWPSQVQSSIRVAKESWALLSSDCRANRPHLKGGIEPQESPWKFSSIYPQNQSLPTFCFVLSPTPLTLQGAVPDYLSLKKRVNLQLQLIKFLGVIVFQPTNSFGSPLACLNRFFQPHVIAQSLPTVRGMRCSKLSKYRFL